MTFNQPFGNGIEAADLDDFLKGEVLPDSPLGKKINAALDEDPDGAVWRYIQSRFKARLREWDEGLFLRVDQPNENELLHKKKAQVDDGSEDTL
jgi:hypothetical protein